MYTLAIIHKINANKWRISDIQKFRIEEIYKTNQTNQSWIWTIWWVASIQDKQRVQKCAGRVLIEWIKIEKCFHEEEWQLTMKWWNTRILEEMAEWQKEWDGSGKGILEEWHLLMKKTGNGEWQKHCIIDPICMWRNDDAIRQGF